MQTVTFSITEHSDSSFTVAITRRRYQEKSWRMILRLRCFILYLTYILKPSCLTADKCSTENHIVRTFEEVKQGKYGVFFTSNSIIVRNSRLELFCQKTIFKIFAKFAGKYLSSRLFFSKVVVSFLVKL